MTNKTTNQAWAKQAAKAEIRLYTFESLVAILEGGCLPGGDASATRVAQKIIKLCKAEQSRQLGKFDRAMEHLK